MAILLLGKSQCPICAEVITERDRYYCFPAFVANAKDLLYFFNDASFHSDCLDQHELAPLAKEYGDLAIKSVNPANRLDLVSGEKITRMEDHLFIGYLTSDKSEFLYQYNFTHLSRKHLHAWASRLKVIEELKKLENSGKWQEWYGLDSLGWLINELSKVPEDGH